MTLVLIFKKIVNKKLLSFLSGQFTEVIMLCKGIITKNKFMCKKTLNFLTCQLLQ